MPAHQDDYGWFSPADFCFVVAALSRRKNTDAFVIIGGQSLVAWTMWYGIKIPPTTSPYLTQDLDVLGLRQDAEWLAEQLGAKVYVADLDRATPNTAQLVLLSRDGKSRLMIDFLNGVLGVEDADVTRLAVTLTLVDFAECPNLPSFKVLHPLICLQSRLENLCRLPAKRSSNGITQGRIAVQVAACYLEEAITSGRLREARQAAARITEFAISRAGLFCYFEYGIDVLAAVKPEKFPPGLWHERDWPRKVSWVQQKRNIFEQKRERSAAHGPRA